MDIEGTLGTLVEVHIQGTLLRTRGVLKLTNIILLKFDTCDWPERITIGLRICHESTQFMGKNKKKKKIKLQHNFGHEQAHI